MEKSRLVAGSSVKDHLDFAERLLGMFGQADERRQGWQERIARARERLADTHYYLAVIGEFNAGKSTVINALLEAELFAAGMRPTTAAAVLITYGRRLVIRVGFRDGRRWVSDAQEVGDQARWHKLRRVAQEDELGAGLTTEEVCERLGGLDILDALCVVTTDETVAPYVKSVEVEYPAPLLASGLVLIDTPGSESGDRKHSAEHARIARQAATDADAAVVITKQDQLLPQSLADFLADALDEGLLARCAFVVTRADQADAEADQFDQLCRDGAKRISALLKLTDPPVAWAAPLQVVRGLRGEHLSEDARTWMQRFDRTRRWLRRIVEERRPAAVADTALRLISELLSGLDSGLASDLSHLEWQQRELAATAPADVTNLLSVQVSTGIQTLDKAEGEALQKVRSMTWSTGESMEAAIRDKLEPCMNGKQIRLVLDEEMQSLVDSELRSLARRAKSVVQDQLTARLADVTGELRAAFAAEYARLERIDAAPAAATLGELRVATASTQSATFDAATAIAAQDSHRDAVTMGGGAGVGALIGTFIVPGFGTVIGAAVGGLLGSLFAESITTVRERAVEAANASAGELVDMTGDRLADATRDLAEKTREELRAQAQWYRSAYDQTIRAMHDAQHAAENALQERHDRLTQARHEAARRRATIAADRARLLSVDRVETTDPFGGSDD